jgi:hypothetical protein
VWIERFESSAKTLICQWETQSKVGSVSEQHDTMLREAEKQNSQLQAMVTHYKTIIEETVSWKCVTNVLSLFLVKYAVVLPSKGFRRNVICRWCNQMYHIMSININTFNNMLFSISDLKKVIQIIFSMLDTVHTAYTLHFCRFLLHFTNKCSKHFW